MTCLSQIPYLLVFAQATCNGDWTTHLALAFDIVFMIDILVNFNCAFVDEKDNLIKNRLRIAKRYARCLLKN
jgi:hypothetical protein